VTCHAKTGSQIEQAVGESDLWRNQGGAVAESGGQINRQINVGDEVVHRRLSHGW
jgi:hypothetical protein